MEQFASGWKRNYYGKADVIVYRLKGEPPLFGANVKMLLYGDAFWPTYATGDNTNLIATDSMKNFIQRETLNFDGGDLDSYCLFLAEKFMRTYPQTEGVQLSAEEIPYAALPETAFAFAPSGPECAVARLELNRDGVVEACSGLRGFRLLRLGGSAFTGFVRDQYTTLPEIKDRPLHMWLDLEWWYNRNEDACNSGRIVARVRRTIHEIFRKFESGSIQELIYQIGNALLGEIGEVSEVHLEAQNRTWDAVTDSVYTDPRPPYGCLGLRLRR